MCLRTSVHWTFLFRHSFFVVKIFFSFTTSFSNDFFSIRYFPAVLLNGWLYHQGFIFFLRLDHNFFHKNQWTRHSKTAPLKVFFTALGSNIKCNALFFGHNYVGKYINWPCFSPKILLSCLWTTLRFFNMTHNNKVATTGLNFINVLRTAFMSADPKSVKCQLSRQYHIMLFGICMNKSWSKNVDEINTWTRQTKFSFSIFY